MDPLSDVLSLLNSQSDLTAGLDVGGRWAIRFTGRLGTIKCYAVTQGTCWLSVDGVADPVRLAAGDGFMLLQHASNADEGGTVRLHLVIHPDGNIWTVSVVEGSGSRSLDGTGASTFRGGFIRPFPDGVPGAELDISLHYVLTHRHDEAGSASAVPAPSRGAFTITNEPLPSPILNTMLLRVCTDSVVRAGIRNHPPYGIRSSARAIFLRQPDGTPWVRFYEDGYGVLSPVTQVGKLVKWTGRQERLPGGNSRFNQYTVWADDGTTLNGSLQITYTSVARFNQDINRGGTVDFTCGNETVPAVAWNAADVTPEESPPGDPP